MTEFLSMELRTVDVDARTISGIVAPYDAVSYLTRDPAGERIMRGAFRKSIEQSGRRIKFCRDHDHAHPVGLADHWTDDDAGLSGVFKIRASQLGDETLEDAREGYMTGLSVGFEPLPGRTKRGADGVREVHEARLHEVSLVMIPAYDGAQVLAVRRARPLEDVLAPFVNRPVVDLSPIPAIWLYDSPR